MLTQALDCCPAAGHLWAADALATRPVAGHLWAAHFTIVQLSRITALSLIPSQMPRTATGALFLAAWLRYSQSSAAVPKAMRAQTGCPK